MHGYLPELFTEDDWHSLARVLALTPRQKEVARLLCHGMTNKEMAKHMSVSEDTIRLHIRELYRRLRVGQRVGVVVKLVLTQRNLSD